ncbi:MAG: HlyD family type I secretion periplasmic adaptor subunit [Alphaproteobacteria bacterium]|nr:MAG: HlyD family type I secretion periplasmic adaptor subunit [Alphaproteobacteria bacterium]
MNPSRAIRNHILLSLAVVVLLVGGIGGWAATSEFAGAVIAQGQLVVDTNVKKVQHPTGGVVAELRVRDGAMVETGDIVIKLDDTQTKANLAIVVKGLDEFAARRAREEAELEGKDTVTFPDELVARKDDPEVAKILSGEAALFEIRRKTREGLKAQLTERVSQSEEEITGLSAQVESKDKQVEWIKKELLGVRELWAKQLVQFTRVTTLEREQARLDGERGQLVASIAQSKGKIAETKIQILQIDQDMRTEVGKDLADIRGKSAELIEKKVAAEDQLKRIDIRAPQSGMVHQLDVHTVGGVISAGQPIMLIVPAADKLIVEARVQPQDIDQVRVGQTAVMRFTNFNSRTTPEINGEVSIVSGDVTQDQRTGASYYTVRIVVAPTELARLDTGVKLVPGMPVEVFIQTTVRTVVSYFVRPFQDQIAKAFREK